MGAWREKKSGCLWTHAPSLEALGGHADLCVLCLHPSGCSKMWDNLTCWPATPPGQVVVLDCPLIYKFFSPVQGKSLGWKQGSQGSTSDASWSGYSPVKEVRRQTGRGQGDEQLGVREELCGRGCARTRSLKDSWDLISSSRKR